MELTVEIENLVEPLLEKDQFLVNIIHKSGSGSGKLLVLVDSDTGLTIHDCARISRKLSIELENRDYFDSNYLLEVSSPGIDQPLQLIRQYLKNIGKKLRIHMLDGQEIEGKLTDVQKDFIRIEKGTLSGKQKINKETLTVSFENIRLAKVLVSFSKY
ncbi:MAG: hypothetical protein IH947_00120 [Bacteroidetes bacterium]|nr:hypothetical protein [Bacteroidota bacterium]